MNEETMKMILASMITNKLQSMSHVEYVRDFREVSTVVFEGW